MLSLGLPPTLIVALHHQVFYQASLLVSMCLVEHSCTHQGRTDLEHHVSSEAHVKKARDVRMNTKISSYVASVPSVANMPPLEAKVRRAKVKMTATMVKHNVPLALTEHFSPLFKEMLPDSEIANGYTSENMHPE